MLIVDFYYDTVIFLFYKDPAMNKNVITTEIPVFIRYTICNHL